MSALHEELVAKAPSSRCITCRFLDTLDAEDRAEWESELRLVTVTNEAFARAITKRGMKVTDGAVRGHRRNHQ